MKAILLIIEAISFTLIPAEAETITLQVLWSGGWMVVFAVCAKILDKYYLTKEEKEEQV